MLNKRRQLVAEKLEAKHVEEERKQANEILKQRQYNARLSAQAQ